MVAKPADVAAAIAAAPARAITPVVVNRRVHSCWADGCNLRIIFHDCTEMKISWGWKHAELSGSKLLADLPAVPITQGPVSRILSGRTIAYCYLNDEDELVIRTACGHEAVIGYDSEPVIRRMDVKVPIESVFVIGDIFGK